MNNLDQEKKTRIFIALGAIVALVIGFAVLRGDDKSQTASARGFGPGGQQMQGAPGGGYGNWQGQQGQQGMNGPQGMNGRQGQGSQQGQGGMRGGPPAMTELTGADVKKAVAAAKKSVSGGAVDHVFKNPRGSGYVVIFETSDHTHIAVEVSTSFKVTAKHTMQGPPNGGQGGPPQQQGGGGTSQQQAPQGGNIQ